jgi:hypothetical protein
VTELEQLVALARRLSDGELAALLSDLQAIQAARWATAHQSTVSHQAGAVV